MALSYLDTCNILLKTCRISFAVSLNTIKSSLRLIRVIQFSHVHQLELGCLCYTGAGVSSKSDQLTNQKRTGLFFHDQSWLESHLIVPMRKQQIRSVYIICLIAGELGNCTTTTQAVFFLRIKSIYSMCS